MFNGQLYEICQKLINCFLTKSSYKAESERETFIPSRRLAIEFSFFLYNEISS
jgi:hypothetical protein